MTTEEYIRRMAAALDGYDKEEVDNAVQYYTEILEDSENPDEQMKSFGSPEELAERIKNVNGWNSYKYMQGGQPTPTPMQYSANIPSKKRMTAGRVIVLVCLSWAWITAYALILTLFAVLWTAYICFPASAAMAFASGLHTVGKYLPYAIELFAIGFALLGATVLLIRPMLSASKGIFNLTAAFSRFLFAIEKKENTTHERKPLNKIALKIGCAALAIGAVMGGITAVLNPSQEDYANALGLETYSREFTAETDSIDLSVDGELSILPSSDDTVSVEVKNVDPDRLTVSDGGTAVIKYKSVNWLSKITFLNVHQPTAEFTLYLPEKKYKKIAVESSVGDINLIEISAGTLSVGCDIGAVELKKGEFGSVDITASLGDISLTDCRLTNLVGESKIEASCGNIELRGVNSVDTVIDCDLGDVTVNDSVFGQFKAYNSCGDVKLCGVTVNGELFADLSMGSGDFTDITAYNLNVNFDCGDFSFGGELTSLNGSDSTIEMSMGDAEITLIGQNYNVKADSDAGTVKINGKKSSDSNLDSGHVIRIHNSCGDIDVDSVVA